MRKALEEYLSKIGVSGVQAEEVRDIYDIVIPPEMALAMMADGRNKDNRRLVMSKVLRFAKIMQHGEWEFTEQGVAVSENGDLFDGQGRLTAIWKSGVPIKVRVTLRAPGNIYSVRDSGAVRNESQFFVTEEGLPVPDSDRVKTIVVLLTHFLRNTTVAVDFGKKRRALAFYESNKDAFDFVLKGGKAYKLPPVIAAPVVYAYKTSPSSVEEFALRFLKDDGERHGYPIKTAIEWHRSHRKSSQGERLRSMKAFTNAVYAHVGNRRLENLKTRCGEAKSVFDIQHRELLTMFDVAGLLPVAAVKADEEDETEDEKEEAAE